MEGRGDLQKPACATGSPGFAKLCMTVVHNLARSESPRRDAGFTGPRRGVNTTTAPDLAK
jgi:hypothetical protein